MIKPFRYNLIENPGGQVYSRKDLIGLEVEIEGKTYRGFVTTVDYIKTKMEEDKKIGENARGSYFCFKGMIVVKEINSITIKRTLEDLMKKGSLESILKR